MMNFAEFIEKVKEGIPQYLSEQLEMAPLDFHEVVKVGDRVLTGIGFGSGFREMSPVVYLDDAYKAYEREEDTVDEICRKVARILSEEMEAGEELCPGASDVRSIGLENLCMALVNTEANRRFLSDKPTLGFGDLSAVFMIVLRSERSTGALMITDYIMEDLGMDVEGMYELALANMKRPDYYKIGSLGDIVLGNIHYEEIGNLEDLPGDGEMYVISNLLDTYGDGLLLCREHLERIADKLGSDLAIIPSSIHEVLVMKFHENGRVRELLNVIRMVNLNEVAPEERLSDNLYLFEKDTSKMYVFDQDGSKEEVTLELPVCVTACAV